MARLVTMSVRGMPRRTSLFGAFSSPQSQGLSSAAHSKLRILPAASILLETKGYDIEDIAKSISASGPKGHILKGDVLAWLSNAPAPARKSQSTANMSASHQVVDVVDSEAEYTDYKNSSMRSVIAKRLTESKTTIPHYYLSTVCFIDDLLAARKRANELTPGKLSINDFIVQAVGIAAHRIPRLADRPVDVSVAVAVDGGLVTPVVRGADRMGVTQISAAIRDYAERARRNRLTPEEYTGGLVSVSNLGMFGVKEFSAVINPPQPAILAVGAGIQETSLDAEGKLTTRTAMNVTLSADAASLSEDEAAALLSNFKSLIENPELMA